MSEVDVVRRGSDVIAASTRRVEHHANRSCGNCDRQRRSHGVWTVPERPTREMNLRSAVTKAVDRVGTPIDCEHRANSSRLFVLSDRLPDPPSRYARTFAAVHETKRRDGSRRSGVVVVCSVRTATSPESTLGPLRERSDEGGRLHMRARPGASQFRPEWTRRHDSHRPTHAGCRRTWHPSPDRRGAFQRRSLP